jgi:predicted secreted hydrolase
MFTASVSDLETEREVSRMVIEPAALSTDHLDVSCELGRFHGSFRDGYQLSAHLDADTGFDLALVPARPVIFAAGGGNFPFAGSTTSQYSVTGLKTSGTVRIDGETLSVAGIGWYDRQWVDTGDLADVRAFTWFGITLDNGDSLSLFDTTVGGTSAGSAWATIARADGTHVVAAAAPARHDARVEYETALGRRIPRQWRLSIPSIGAELDVAQRLVHDEEAAFFYTGALTVTGTYEGSAITGQGFCDLARWTDSA